MLWRNKEAVFIMLEVGNVKRSMPDYDKVVDLFNEAFPDYELYPIWVMRLMALRKGVDFLAFYDGDEFIGINYGAYTDRLYFGLYIAIVHDKRSEGYGTQIIDMMRKRYSGKEYTFNIEVIDESADNVEQRKKRLKLYERDRFPPYGLCADRCRRAVQYHDGQGNS